MTTDYYGIFLDNLVWISNKPINDQLEIVNKDLKYTHPQNV